MIFWVFLEGAMILPLQTGRKGDRGNVVPERALQAGFASANNA